MCIFFSSMKVGCDLVKNYPMEALLRQLCKISPAFDYHSFLSYLLGLCSHNHDGQLKCGIWTLKGKFATQMSSIFLFPLTLKWSYIRGYSSLPNHGYYVTIRRAPIYCLRAGLFYYIIRLYSSIYSSPFVIGPALMYIKYKSSLGFDFVVELCKLVIR